MAGTPLVDLDVRMGRELIQLLDERGFPITGAAWIFVPEMGQWRLFLRTPRAAVDLLQAYRDVSDAMDDKGDLRTRLELSRVKLVPPTDRTLLAMGRVVREPGLAAIPFASNVVDGIFLDDALVYRLAA